jgi:copper chaperone CopZ
MKQNTQNKNNDSSCCSVDEESGDTVEGGLGILSAVLGSACCWIPAILVGLGASAVGIGTFLRAYHLPLAIGTALLLSAGWGLFVYKRVWGNKRWSSGWMILTILITSTLVSGYYLGPHYYGGRIGGKTIEAEEVPDVEEHRENGLRRATFSVLGMSCSNCAQDVESALRNAQGVIQASVGFSSSEATVYMNRSVSKSQLRDVVSSSGYEIGPSIQIVQINTEM